MHTWVRRGLQTTLVTGGLLMLGTGIASATENVNPDQPPSPVDAGVSVPIDTSHNAVGTPFGQYETPSVHRTVSTGDLTADAPSVGNVTPDALPTKALPTNSLPTNNLPTSGLTNAVGQANPLVRQASPSLQGLGGQSGLFRGNRVHADVVVPVQICGNAVAVGGDAAESATCSQMAGHTHRIRTNGDDQALAGNVVSGDATVPVQVAGNAVGALGNAFSHSVAGQSGTTGGDIRTSGDAGTVSGTIAAVQWATPVQVADNAIAGAGVAGADSASESDGRSPGSLRTSGDSGTGAGTVAGVPVAVPFQVDGNGVSGIGNSASHSMTTSNATAGSTNAHNIGLWGHPTWVMTSGDPSTASGNVAQPQLSGPVSLDDNAAGAIGNSSADSINNSTDSAGGLSSTTGNGSTGSGNFVDAPVALPSSGAGNAVTGIGNAAAKHTNNVTSNAGGDTLTNGDNSTLSGNSANVPPAGAVDVCGDAAGGAGTAGGTCDNNVTSATGGYNGTTGNGGTGSGNIGQTPVAAPVESFGTAVGGAGNASSSADESKSITSGGTPNSADDNGTLTSNVVSTPTAVPAQVYGDAADVVGNSGVMTDSDTTTTAGGPAKATGHNGTGAGNIVFVPTSAPTQAFGDTNTIVGNGAVLTNGSTMSTAGGDAHSNGAGGSVSGNVVQVAANPVNQVFGEAANLTGIGATNTNSTLDSTAGGDTSTTGDNGDLSGNAVAVPATVVDQFFGDAVAAGAHDVANGTNDSYTTTGGQVTSSGRHGSGSGNVLTVPAAVDPDLFGDAVSVLGTATGAADQESVIENGGDSWTHGGGPLDAYNFNEPLGFDLDIADAPIGILGRADTLVEDNSVLDNGESASHDSMMALPGGFGGVMGYGAQTPEFPDLPMDSMFSVPQVPSFDGAPGVASTQSAPAMASLGTLPGVPQVPSVPLVQGGLGKAGQLPAQHVTAVPMSAVGSVQSLGSTGTGVAGVGTPGISGVLPVHSGLLPRI